MKKDMEASEARRFLNARWVNARLKDRSRRLGRFDLFRRAHAWKNNCSGDGLKQSAACRARTEKSPCQKRKRYVSPGRCKRNANREISAPDPTQARHICHFIW
jgi:hypothetical protein